MSSDKISVLHVVNKWDHGGVERYIEGLTEASADSSLCHTVLSLCTHIDSSAHFQGKFGPLYSGDGLYAILRASLRFGAFLDSHRFDVVHIHASNGSCFLLARIARLHGVAIRIVHSHNSSMQAGSGIVKKLANQLLIYLFAGNESVRLACSTEAGRHLFKNRDFEIMPNGIDIDRFAFNQQARSKIRSKLGVNENTTIILCVGSLIEAKNHFKAIKIFSKYTAEVPDSLLVILGDGPLRERLEVEIESLGIAHKVFMPGFLDDAELWLSASDIVLFPSLFEGLPISLVEAQCNGLPIVCSDSVTQEVALMDNFQFLSLSAPDDEWVAALVAARRCFGPLPVSVVCGKGFNRKDMVVRLSAKYEQVDL